MAIQLAQRCLLSMSHRTARRLAATCSASPQPLLVARSVRRAGPAASSGARHWAAAAGQVDPASPSLTAGASASLILGRGRISPGAVVLQSNAIFKRLRGGHATAAQLVEALRQLAAIAREASAEDLEGLCAGAPFRQLLEDLTVQLPRDAGERTGWGSSWTAQVIEALRDLRVHDVDPRLGVRLGHTLVQTASDPQLEVEALCHAVCNLTAADTRGLSPDSYTTWVLGRRFEELLRMTKAADMSTERLVHLLHLLAHPSLRERVPARWSPLALERIANSLRECGIGEVAKVVQAYAGVAVADHIILAALQQLLSSTVRGVQSATLAELAAVADVLPGRLADDADTINQLAVLVLQRLVQLLSEARPDDEGGVSVEKKSLGVDLELAATTAAGAAKSLPQGSPAAAHIADALQAVGALVLNATAASSSSVSVAGVPADAMAQLLRLGASQTKVSLETSSAWPGPLAAALSPRLGELTSARLAELAVALAASDLDCVEPRFFQSLQATVAHRAPSITVAEFGTVAKALATVSVLDDTLLEAFDVEACLVQPAEPKAVAAIAWSMAVADAGSDCAWMLVAAQLENASAKWRSAANSTRGLLFEALVAHRELHNISWEGAVAEALKSTEWRDNWHELRAQVAAPSVHGDLVAQLLSDLGISAERDQESENGLHLMPFVLDGKVVLDMMPTAARHPVSRSFRGESKLRHSVWSAGGRSVLAVPDSIWTDLAAMPATLEGSEDTASVAEGPEEAKERQKKWLQKQLVNLRRSDMVKDAELPEDTEALLADVPFGDEGISVDALRVLASKPKDVRNLAVKRFLATWQEPHVRNPTAWFIGIVKQSQQQIDKELKEKEELEGQNRQQAPRETSPGRPLERPVDGWEHKGGRPLEDISLNERVSGRVTNMWERRVWVDVGFVKDAFFVADAPGTYKIGEHLKGIRVKSIDLANSRVEVRVMQRSTKAGAAGTPAASKSPADGSQETDAKASDANVAAKSKVSEKLIATTQAGEDTGKDTKRRKQTTQAKKPRPVNEQERAEKMEDKKLVALRFKPVKGWNHDGGRDLAEVLVGEVLTGTVTNVYLKRVWVDIGAVRDASFLNETPGVSYKIGDIVNDLSVQSVNLDTGLISVQAPVVEQTVKPLVI